MHKLVYVAMLMALGASAWTLTKATTEDGQQVLLNDDGTWRWADVSRYTNAQATPKYIEDAVEVWDVTFIHVDKDDNASRFRNSVRLSFHYWNKTKKKIVGVILACSIKSPLGKVILDTTFEDEGVVPAETRQKADKWWHWQENQFSNDQPYNFMWEVAKNGTARITTEIRKVVFEDGQVLTERKPRAGK